MRWTPKSKLPLNRWPGMAHFYTLHNLQWGKKLFDPLLILYFCPLTKKWSVYNFNGRFIWTVRDRITTKNAFQKSYKLICILMNQISIWSPIKSTRFLAPRCLLSTEQSPGQQPTCLQKWTFNWNCLDLSCWSPKSSLLILLDLSPAFDTIPDLPVNPIEKAHLRNRTPVVWVLPLR